MRIVVVGMLLGDEKVTVLIDRMVVVVVVAAVMSKLVAGVLVVLTLVHWAMWTTTMM
jgi:hypothetical protein